jgi:hypothetical protein
MHTSEQMNEIATALAKAQGQMEAATKDALNPHFKQKYADLASVREAIKKPLSENGIAYIQTVRSGEGFVSVETRLIHTARRSAWPADAASRWLCPVLRAALFSHGDRGTCC